MGGLVPKETLPDLLYVELHADLADFLIDRDYGGWEGLTEAEQADLRERASRAAHALIRASLAVLGKDLQTAIEDKSIYAAIVAPLPAKIPDICIYVNGKKSDI